MRQFSNQLRLTFSALNAVQVRANETSVGNCAQKTLSKLEQQSREAVMKAALKLVLEHKTNSAPERLQKALKLVLGDLEDPAGLLRHRARELAQFRILFEALPVKDALSSALVKVGSANPNLPPVNVRPTRLWQKQIRGPLYRYIKLF